MCSFTPPAVLLIAFVVAVAVVIAVVLSLQRVFVVLWICSRSIVLVELPVFSFFIVVAGHLLLLTWLNSHFFLLSLSLPRFAWVSIALFNY